jgi:hypothetical protein
MFVLPWTDFINVEFRNTMSPSLSEPEINDPSDDVIYIGKIPHFRKILQDEATDGNVPGFIIKVVSSGKFFGGYRVYSSKFATGSRQYETLRDAEEAIAKIRQEDDSTVNGAENAAPVIKKTDDLSPTARVTNERSR